MLKNIGDLLRGTLSSLSVIHTYKKNPNFIFLVLLLSPTLWSFYWMVSKFPCPGNPVRQESIVLINYIMGRIRTQSLRSLALIMKDRVKEAIHSQRS